MRPGGAVVNYLSADATSLNTLTVTLREGRVVFADRTVDGGMDPGTCTPGDVDAAGYIVTTSCPAGGVRRVRIDLGEREDTATVGAAMAATVLGGAGADTLKGGPEADDIDGGTGDDRLDGQGGDDILRARDGSPDRLTCGSGDDTAVVDQLDEVAADCERVDRATVPVAAGGGAGDRTAPKLRATAPSRQRVGTRRTVRLVVASSEAGGVAASGTLDVDDTSLPVEVARKTIGVAGEGVELRLSLSRAEHARVLRALRRGRRARVRLTVVATDRAGNSRERKLRAIALVR